MNKETTGIMGKHTTKRFLRVEDLFEVKCKKCGSLKCEYSIEECEECGDSVAFECRECGSKYSSHAFMEVEK